MARSQAPTATARLPLSTLDARATRTTPRSTPSHTAHHHASHSRTTPPSVDISARPATARQCGAIHTKAQHWLRWRAADGPMARASQPHPLPSPPWTPDTQEHMTHTPSAGRRPAARRASEGPPYCTSRAHAPPPLLRHCSCATAPARCGQRARRRWRTGSRAKYAPRVADCSFLYAACSRRLVAFPPAGCCAAAIAPLTAPPPPVSSAATASRAAPTASTHAQPPQYQLLPMRRRCAEYGSTLGALE